MSTPMFPTIIEQPSASATSLSPPSNAYDVFINFRGDNIASQLAQKLSNILVTRTLINDGLELIFDEYCIQVQDAIKRSRCLVIFLTEDYVKSITGLRELSKIVEYRLGEDCKEVIPVFCQDPPILVKELQDFVKFLKYYNKGKEETFFKWRLSFKILKRTNRTSTYIPPELREHILDYIFSEEDNQKLLMEIPAWKSALERISSSPNTILVEENSSPLYIIRKVKEIIMKVVEGPPKLIGISPQLHRIMDNLLELGSNDVRFIGIVGMSGIGKTTLAKAVCQELEPKFEYNNHCFLGVHNEKLVSVQKKLLLRLGGKLDIVIKNEDHGAKLIKKCLRNKKVLIVLDAVDEIRQINKLAGSPDWFSPGSRIIITTRNRNICRQLKYKHKIFEYDVECLDHNSAFLLFCKHAFGKDIHEPPNENFRYLTEEMVKLIEGHPLALITIGSFLYGKDIYTWEDHFSDFDKLLYRKLFHETLKTSIEGLDEDSQQIFLDLACLFNNGMSMDILVETFESLGYTSAYTILHLLAERNLVQMSYKNVHMHTLVRFMGRIIARFARRTQSRIWNWKDAHRVFRKESGLKYVKGIVIMDMEDEELVLEAKPFEYMTELKILKINNVKVNENIQFLSNKLRFLNWNGYPSNYLPSTFEPQSIVELHLCNSKLVQLWEGKKEFIWLKEIDVSGSEYLVKTPDFSKVPNLQRLILRNCKRLCWVHPSITTLNHLLLVDMANCVNLKTFPSKLITSQRLQTLILSNLGIDESFPEIEETTKSLFELHLDGTLIHDLPMSVEHLTVLTLLNLRDCTQLSSLPESVCRLMSLQTLNLNGCKSLHQIPSPLETIPSLTMLDIGGTLIDKAPNAITSFSNLETLNCEKLSSNIWRSLSGLVGKNHVFPLRDLNLSACKLVDEDIPDDLNCLSLLEILDLSNNSFVKLKKSLTQLTNLKALYLNDCNDIQPQLLPKFLTTLQYVGGLNSLKSISHNDEGSSGSKSACPPLSPPKTVTKIENVVYEIEEEKSHEEVVKKDLLNTHSKFEKVCSEKLVGMKEQLEEVLELLDLKESNEVHFVGIYGMGGVGKTTIAQVAYNEIVGKFESSCFLHVNRGKNLVSLQHQLLSQLLWKDNIEIRDEDYGAQMIENEMKSRMALVVLDDIDEKRQVEVLVGSPDWFGHGSRVIITTRNREIINQLNYRDKMREYNVKLLSQENANLLFCKYAFGNNDNAEDKNDDLCIEIVKKVEGLPLALIVIGSALRNEDKAKWKEMSSILCNVEEDFFSQITNKKRLEDQLQNEVVGEKFSN